MVKLEGDRTFLQKQLQDISPPFSLSGSRCNWDSFLLLYRASLARFFCPFEDNSHFYSLFCLICQSDQFLQAPCRLHKTFYEAKWLQGSLFTRWWCCWCRDYVWDIV